MTDICAALGLAAGTRIVTLHVDDVGMCHGCLLYTSDAADE